MAEISANKNKENNAGVVTCSACGGLGIVIVHQLESKSQPCFECGGVGVWLARGDEKYFWQQQNEAVSSAFRRLDFIMAAAVKVLAIFFIAFSYYRAVLFLESSDNVFALFIQRGPAPFLFWISTFILIYWIYSRRVAAKKEREKDFDIFKIVLGNFDKEEARQGNGFNIESLLDPSAKRKICEAGAVAKELKSQVSIWHLLKVLLEDEDIERIITRIEVSQKEIIKLINNKIKETAAPVLGKEKVQFDANVKKAVIGSLREAVKMGRKNIDKISLFVSVAINLKNVNFFLQGSGISAENLHTAILWSQRKNNGGFFQTLFAKKGTRRVVIKHRIMNRAWTARQTPILDRFSYDITDLAAAGFLPPIVGREQEISEVMRILERKSKNNVLLIGEVGSGRRSIVRAIGRLMAGDNCLSKLKDKRLVSLDASLVISGVRAGGELEERIQKILQEVQLAGNIILFIPDIHSLADSGSEHGFDVSEILAPVFRKNYLQVIGTTTFFDYRQKIEKRGDFADTFDMVKVEEVAPDIALEILSRESRGIEEKEEVLFTFNALKKAVELSQRYITNKLLPAKAVDLLGEAAVMVRVRSGKGSLVKSKDIMVLVTEKTGVPVIDISGKEAERLNNLESEIHKRMIGQDLAVKAIAEAIKRMRVGLKNEKKPMGVFLFLGPTGVGKTELAKTLAEAYFGSEKLMVRLDMSEFQSVQSVERLIGSPDGAVSGQLTEAVKNKPFSLVLLDEFEKAHPNVLNLFLQVFDDGRLTDSLGRLVDFTNTIIIATSNAGSKIIQERLAEGKTIPEFQTEFEKNLLEHFKPELLNRFNAQIIFKTLSEDDISQIAKLQIKNLSKRLEAAQGIELKITDDVVAKISRMGYSPFYGARNLQRVITDKLENIIADKFLKGEIKRGHVYTIREIE
ncbi:MAG: AAA family ATPase [Patescibacteria group bacterium]|nr:AAA family ATPase [Patescibacteria group bacterium]MBU4142352.1 AAA family ATPase [Patescibacteria group bacterium]